MSDSDCVVFVHLPLYMYVVAYVCVVHRCVFEKILLNLVCLRVEYFCSQIIFIRTLVALT